MASVRNFEKPHYWRCPCGRSFKKFTEYKGHIWKCKEAISLSENVQMYREEITNMMDKKVSP